MRASTMVARRRKAGTMNVTLCENKMLVEATCTHTSVYAEIAAAMSLFSFAMVARFFKMRNFSLCRVEHCPEPLVGGGSWIITTTTTTTTIYTCSIQVFTWGYITCAALKINAQNLYYAKTWESTQQFPLSSFLLFQLAGLHLYYV